VPRQNSIRAQIGPGPNRWEHKMQMVSLAKFLSGALGVRFFELGGSLSTKF
jgi:hypothetical protein